MRDKSMLLFSMVLFFGSVILAMKIYGAYSNGGAGYIYLRGSSITQTQGMLGSVLFLLGGLWTFCCYLNKR